MSALATKYRLVPLGSGQAGPLDLPCPGTLKLGRSVLASLDTRCSRNHVEFCCDVDTSTGARSLSVTLLGSNAAWLFPAGPGSAHVVLAKGVPVRAVVGDSIGLLGCDYRYRIEEQSDPPPHLEAAPSATTPDVPPQAKRPRPGSPEKSSVPWSSALSVYTRDVDRPEVVLATADTVVIQDLYPKSAVHLLAMMRANFDSGHPQHPRDLRKQHLPRVRAMAEAAMRAAQAKVAALCLTGEKARIRLGFHRAPSIRPLHLHAISQDFSGEALKTAKHWNSFTDSQFFVPVEDVIKALEAAPGDGAEQMNAIFGDRERAEAMLKRPLRCHRCGAAMRNLPSLKEHIAACQQTKQ